MSTEQDTFDRLRRIPFSEMKQILFDADPGGSYTFSRLNGVSPWKLIPEFAPICLEHHWTIEEVNEQYNKEFNGKEYRFHQET